MSLKPTDPVTLLHVDQTPEPGYTVANLDGHIKAAEPTLDHGPLFEVAIAHDESGAAWSLPWGGKEWRRVSSPSLPPTAGTLYFWPPTPNPESYEDDMPNEGIAVVGHDEGTDFGCLDSYHADYQGCCLWDNEDWQDPRDHEGYRQPTAEYAQAYDALKVLCQAYGKDPQQVYHHSTAILIGLGWTEMVYDHENDRLVRKPTIPPPPADLVDLQHAATAPMDTNTAVSTSDNVWDLWLVQSEDIEADHEDQQAIANRHGLTVKTLFDPENVLWHKPECPAIVINTFFGAWLVRESDQLGDSTERTLDPRHSWQLVELQ